MSFQRPPRLWSVLASVLAASGVVLALASCSSIAPLGPTPEPAHAAVQSTPVGTMTFYRLGSPIILQVMHSQTVTEGYLSRSGANVIWGSQVPLDRPFRVRDPLWTWDTGRILTNGNGSAISTIVAGLFFDGIALLLLYILVVLMRDTSPRRIQRRSMPAGADPGGIRRTHHPDRAHHSDGTRRRARRVHRQRSTRSR